MKIGIIRERKNPPDRRAVFSPSKASEVMKEYPDVEIVVEESDNRFFSDDSYRENGIKVVDDLSDCDILLGVKEVPVDALIPNKTYFFFSHTIKKQKHNRKLLQACLEKNIRLIDFETLVDDSGHRLIGFGRYAGIVGAYNTLRTFGIKYELFNLVKAEGLQHQNELIERLKRPYLPPIKIVLTGFGKVGKGAKEMLDGMKMKEVSIDDFLSKSYDVPVYTHIDTKDYYKRIDGQDFDKQDFYQHPEKYTSNFERFSQEADVFIAGHFYKNGSPKILTREMLNAAKNTIKVIGDISCDVDNGPIDSTLRVSTIAEPFYGYYPRTGEEVHFEHPGAVVVMAIDNLPCELPQDATDGFGEMFTELILPEILKIERSEILNRATITENGKLRERYLYLEDYVNG